MSADSNALAASSRAVFLSYAHEDTAAAQRIAEALRAAGVEVWFDADGGLQHGDEWDHKIRRQIKECVLFIPLISANTQARHEGYFRIEWNLAAERSQGIAQGVPFILPVAIDDTREPDALIPDLFRRVQWTRLPAGHVPSEVQARLLKVWSQRIGAVTPTAMRAKDQAAGPGGFSPAAAAKPIDRVLSDQMTPTGGSRTSRRRFVPVLIAAGLLMAVGLGVVAHRNSQHSAAVLRLHETILPEIQGLIGQQEIGAAFALAVQADRDVPGDAELAALWPQISVTTTIESVPSGADVYVKQYRKPQSEWEHLGKTPLKDVRLPAVYSRWKVEMHGCAPIERASATGPDTHFVLDPMGAIPADMVRVAAGTPFAVYTGFPTMPLGDFLIDRFEVTNRKFKEFVDHGGYSNVAFWKVPFTKSNQVISRAEALQQFRDSTGQSGPATWRNGTYPENTADLPVTGISWYEAAAYAEFAGKRLPSIYHWRSAAMVAPDESVVPLSNFAGHGLAPVGSYQGMSACGAYDMAGNAKEWCANAAGPDVRYILGGSWREPDYMFAMRDALSPFDRSEANGFRCMKLLGSEPLPPAVDAEFVPMVRDYTNEKPVDDEAFRVIRSLYTYDKTPLDSRPEGTDDTDPRWRREKVSFRAAYGAERVPAYLFLPKNSSPPYQTILYFPGSGSQDEKSSENLHDMGLVAVMVASGRAVVYPVYKGTYERAIEGYSQNGLRNLGPAADRDWNVMLSKDLGRTIDYLETRPDIQTDKLAYMGYSWGAAMGVILPVLENRIKVNILMIGGFYEFRPLPEVDQINFAPRNTVPTLMLNGRYDFRFPLETSQRPMFRWLGAPPEQKRQVLFDNGHALKPEQIAGEAYSWLDRYLGLVK